MKAYSFNITIAAETLDLDDVESFINASLEEHLPEDVLCATQKSGVKQYSEQGWKVARMRKFGIDVKQAGDAHKATLVVESAKTDNLLAGV